MNIVLQANNKLQTNISNNGNVVFDDVSFDSGGIVYDNSTGVFTINTAGKYCFVWWMASASSIGSNGISLCLTDLDSYESFANTPLKSNQFSGISVIDAQNVPLNLQLVNKTNGTIYLPSNLQVKGSIVVFQEIANEISGFCFGQENFAHLLQQFVTEYSSTIWSVFADTLISTTGTPVEVYTAPDGNGPGLLILTDASGTIIFPINELVAIYPGDGTVYNPDFTFLTPPDPFPSGCDSDVLLAIKSYIPVGTPIQVRLGPNVAASGNVYKNEIGVMVLSDDDGNTPIILQCNKLVRAYITNENNLMRTQNTSVNKLPKIIIEDNNK